MNYDDLVSAYEVDVRFPDASGMEHLEMLLNRSQIAHVEHELSEEQRVRLAEADKVLLQQADRFYRAINKVADLGMWRRQEDAPAAHWWWYLDVLVQLPDYSARESIPEFVPA